MIKAIQSGGRQQHEALQALYRKAAEFRRFFVFRHRVPEPVAEDLVQDVCIKIFRSAGSYSGSGGFGDGSANAWMWTIARNMLIDYQRKTKPVEVALDDDGMEAAQRQAIEAEMAQLNPLANAETSAQDCVAMGFEDFAAEHPDRARALEMQLDGESIVSIANRIGRTEAAAKEYLSQCKKKLAPFIAHCTELLVH